jgi:flavodoxin
MKVKVLYHSKSGNTKKVAEAIARATGQVEEAIPPAYPLENIDVLFLGAGIRAGKVDKKVQEFVRTLTPARAKKVVVFGTAGSPEGAFPLMKKMMEEKGLKVADEFFMCKGKWFFFMDRGHPNAADLEAAANFAKKIIG